MDKLGVLDGVPPGVDADGVTVIPYSYAPKLGASPEYGKPTSVPASIKSLPDAKCKNDNSGNSPSDPLDPSTPVLSKL